MIHTFKIVFFSTIVIMAWACTTDLKLDKTDQQIEDILKQMTLDEKIGQMSQVHSPGVNSPDLLRESIVRGEIGSILNETRPEVIRELQRIAVEESRLGIPLLFGRDVIHGFKTIFPINIGLAASFNPELVRQAAEIAAREVTSVGVNWNFGPMIDLSRDPRWGRMAEGFGEDPLILTKMGLAMLKGFQGDDLSLPNTMAACAKHFAAYGANEGGRDYNTASVPEVELWNTYFPPFKAMADSGVATFMTGFNELNGIPATGNKYLFRDVLKDRWNFEGFVVSDWGSIVEMIDHGFVHDTKEAAEKAVIAGVDMEMASTSYKDHLKELVNSGTLSESLLDDAVRRILKVKFDLGLFDDPYVDPDKVITIPPAEHLEAAKKSAIQSFVLLKNDNDLLPLDKNIPRVAVIGPMADDRYEQLGTWVFDGDTSLSVTPLMAFQDFLGKERINYAKGVQTTRSMGQEGFSKAISAARQSDAVIVFAGEESILTGEAHSRAYLDLPGAQNDLIKEIARTSKPVVLVVMTARPLTIGEISEHVDAVLYAWHPGTMAGPALVDVLFGLESPSGKLPVTFPKAAGQIPVYYSHKNTGRPPNPDEFIPMEDIPVRTFQTSLGNTSHYMDIGFKPLYPFGFGLSYTYFEYSNFELSSETIGRNDTLMVSIKVSNTGQYEADEVVQLYLRDLVASVTRPVKELKDFTRVRLKPGESKFISFNLHSDQIGFYDAEGNYKTEAGEFQVWVGGSSDSEKSLFFTLTE